MNDKLSRLGDLKIDTIKESMSVSSAFSSGSESNTDFQKNVVIVQETLKEKMQLDRNVDANIQKITDNMEWLTQTVNLIRINNEKQTELLEIIKEILALANEDDKNVAESKLKDILNKAHGFKNHYELIEFLGKMGEEILKLAGA